MSLFILDTDTISLLQRGSIPIALKIAGQGGDSVAITVITVEEQIEGRFASLRAAKSAFQMATAYQQLGETVSALGQVRILPFTEAAIGRFEKLKALKLNVGAKDLRIAAIVLENDGVLVTRNRRDFERVPDLVWEDWTTV